MDIVFHLGVHQTDEDRLVQCLLANRAALVEYGIAIPSPGQYRQQLRKLAHEMRDQPTNAQTQEALLDAILDDDEVRRVVFSWENFLAMTGWAVNRGRLYPSAGERIALMRRLFPTADVSVSLAIRNPATFLPALVRADSSGNTERETQACDPAITRWSAVMAQIVHDAPDVPITVWCDEDTALLWPEVLRSVAGHPPQMVLDGWLAWYEGLVTPKGLETMRRWFATHAPEDDLLRRKTLSALITRFARPDPVEADPQLPGWSEDTVEALSVAYEEDLDLIASMPGVTFLEP